MREGLPGQPGGEAGLAAWAILEDIALDARLDDAGRLVAETNVRRIADNLGIGNAVSRHLGRLREYGFVLHEGLGDPGSGRYEVSALDPSARIERFTTTPKASPSRWEPEHAAEQVAAALEAAGQPELRDAA